ncbi:7531_t:CDS:2, partial [Funneliformis caledonium]
LQERLKELRKKYKKNSGVRQQNTGVPVLKQFIVNNIHQENDIRLIFLSCSQTRQLAVQKNKKIKHTSCSAGDGFKGSSSGSSQKITRKRTRECYNLRFITPPSSPPQTPNFSDEE